MFVCMQAAMRKPRRKQYESSTILIPSMPSYVIIMFANSIRLDNLDNSVRRMFFAFNASGKSCFSLIDFTVKSKWNGI